MKTNKGWIKLWRELAGTQFWVSEPFSPGQAWVDLMLMAAPMNAEDAFPGEIFDSVRSLSRRWQWTRYRTEKFLRDLEDMGWIDLCLSYFGVRNGNSEHARPCIYLTDYEASQSAPPGFPTGSNMSPRPSEGYSTYSQSDFQPCSRNKNKGVSHPAPVKKQPGRGHVPEDSAGSLTKGHSGHTQVPEKSASFSANSHPGFQPATPLENKGDSHPAPVKYQPGCGHVPEGSAGPLSKDHSGCTQVPEKSASFPANSHPGFQPATPVENTWFSDPSPARNQLRYRENFGRKDKNSLSRPPFKGGPREGKRRRKEEYSLSGPHQSGGPGEGKEEENRVFPGEASPSYSLPSPYPGGGPGAEKGGGIRVSSSRAASPPEYQVPPAYADRFKTWEDYFAWMCHKS